MTPRPTIFISAVSKELKTSRQLVANTLQSLGYEPVWQDIFGTEQGDLRGMLRRQIDECKGVVQLVGRRYGAEPAVPDEHFGRVSYTQYEALYARQQGKKVWYLFLNDDFPIDSAEPEPDELQKLQAAYRLRMKAEAQLYHPLNSREALEISVLKLRDDLKRLRRGVKQWAVAVIGLLLVLVGIVVWLMIRQEQMARLWRQGVTQFADAQTKIRQSGLNQNAEELQHRTYDELAKELGVDPKALREKLPQIAEELKRAPNTSAFERASAAYVTRDYAEAERLALVATDELQDPGDIIKAYQLAAHAAAVRVDYAGALRRLRAAEKLTDRARSPLPWADVQRDIAFVLDEQGHYADAEQACRNALEEFRHVRGDEDENVLALRNNLALVLDEEGNHAQAATELREVIKLETKALGANHPATLMSGMNLANALLGQGRFADAETEYQAVIQREEKIFGLEHSETLASRNNLAITLFAQGKYPEAETELRDVIKLEDGKLGPKHPHTLASRDTFAVALEAQGKLTQAETESRNVVQLREEVLGPLHADTLNSHNNLALILNDEQKFTEAEMESHRVLDLDAKILPNEHPYRLESRHNLAVALCGQGRFVEAEVEFQKTIELREKILGMEHPETLKTCYRFALCLKAENKMPEAGPFARRAAEGALKGLDATHPDALKYQKLWQELATKK